MIRPSRRRLDAEERRLWAEVARSVRPLGGRSAEPPVPAEVAAAAGDDPAPPAPPPGSRSPLPPPRGLHPAPLDRKAMRALARGRARPDASLDLHGLTQAEAHRVLLGFLREARGRGHALVLVVTGRGDRGGGPGILRRMVPHWLRLPELRPVVLGFEEAGPRQGGAGALYVRLRRDRREPG